MLNTNSTSIQAPMTLESLLDSPLMTQSPLSESPTASPQGTTNTAQTDDNHPHTTQPQNAPTTTQNVFTLKGPHKSAVLREFCIEILFVLRNQDINGYFLSQPSNVNEFKGLLPLGLVDIEKRLLDNKYRTLNHFKSDISQLFVVALTINSPASHAYNEARRLLTLCCDWFASLPEQYVNALNVDDASHVTNPSSSLDAQLTETLVSKDTYLSVLNPDNHGVLSHSEHIRTIGEEIGPLKSGTHLLLHGGYREDRRNKVVPYTYLDYGPFYSFAPHYDSGASHCTPESHQLVLGTTWLPARTKFLTPAPPQPLSTSPHAGEMDDIIKALDSDTVRAALSTNDHSLVVSLAVAEMEQQSTFKLANELDGILPGPEVDDDCVYSMCLANALTSSAVKLEQNEQEATDNPIKLGHTILGNREHVVDLDESEFDDVDPSPPLIPPVDSFDAGQELAESASDLMSLYCTQYRRLGDLSAGTTAVTLCPTTSETDVAHRLVGRLMRLSSRARPRDLVHPYTVRKCMGMKPDSFPLPPIESEWMFSDANFDHVEKA